MLRTQLAALTLAATALAASGCGGSSKSTSSSSAATTTTETTASTTAASVPTPPPTTSVKVATGTPLSRVRFIAAADAICAKTNTKLSAVTVITGKEFARELPQVVIYDATELEELSKLVPPASLAHDWGTILDDFHMYTEDSGMVARDLQTNNRRAIAPTVTAAQNLHRALDAIAARDGMRHCNTNS